MHAKLILSNGMIFEGISVGADGTAYGEICFNTSMSGYQEILTDPSYTEQIVVMTYPEIGNCGINSTDFENDKVFAKGLIMKNYCQQESHYQAKETLSDFLKKNDVVAISNVDTRQITSLIRDKGTMACLITTQEITSEMKEKLATWQMDKEVVKLASQNKKYHIDGNGKKVAVIDLGIKNSILKNLTNSNCDVFVYPYNTKADEILKDKFDAIFFSNGVGNPSELTSTIETAKDLLGKLPVYGCCLGAQIIALALGGKITKLKYGHCGGNQPVINLLTNKVLLTSQHHNYVIDELSLPQNVIPTYRNLNDGTLEGFACKDKMVEAVQFHLEASAEGTDCYGVFAGWFEQIEGLEKCQRI